MSKAKLWVLIPIAVVVSVGFSLAQRESPSKFSPSKTPLRGRVKSSDGKPMEGVAISARAGGETIIRTSVYTDRDGRYFFPPLAPPLEDGQYSVWAQAVGFEAGQSAVKLSAENTVEQNFALKPLQDFTKQLSGAEYMASLPESTPQDRRGKRLVIANCSSCHSANFVLQNRFDATGWDIIVTLMETISTNGQDVPNEPRRAFIHVYKEEIVAYLTRVRGPSSEVTFKPFPRVSGEGTKIVVTEYDVSPGHLPGSLVVQNGSDWSLGTPSRHESRAVHDLVVDQQGNVWFGDAYSPRRSLGKLDPRIGRVTDYTELSEKGLPVGVHDLNVDPMGNVWVANGADGSLDKFDPKTEKFQHFPVPASLPRGIGGLVGKAVDSKGNVWVSVMGKGVREFDPKWGIEHFKATLEQPGGAMKLDPKTGEYTFYKAVTPVSYVYAVSIDAEDNAYFTQTGGERIGVVDGRTGKVGEIALSPLREEGVEYTALDKELAATFEASPMMGPPWQKGPRRHAADKNGNTIWFALSKVGKIAKVDIHTRKVTEYSLPYRYSFPYNLTVDKNHMLWVSAINTDRLFKFNPSTEQWTEYPLPTLQTDIRSVAVDNSTNPPTLWMAYWGTSKLARIQFRANAAVSRAAGR